MCEQSAAHNTQIDNYKNHKNRRNKIFVDFDYCISRAGTYLRQYSGIYASTDKKPAVLRDFSCIDFGMGEKSPFLGGKIRFSIHCPFSDSQW